MKPHEQLLDLEKLVNLFFAFVIGTICIFIHQFVPIPIFSWSEGLRLGLLLTGLFTYEIVLIKLIAYYVSKTKKRFGNYFHENRKLCHSLMIYLFGITYIILNTIIEKSILVFFRDIAMVGLIIVVMPFVSNYFDKKKMVKVYNKV